MRRSVARATRWIGASWVTVMGGIGLAPIPAAAQPPPPPPPPVVSTTAAAPVDRRTDRYHPVDGLVLPLLRLRSTGEFVQTVRPGEVVEVDIRTGFGGVPTVVPADATAVWVVVSAGWGGYDGALQMHPCDRAAEPFVDSVLPIGVDDTGDSEVIVPVVDGRFCLGTTVLMAWVQIRILGYVDTTGGAAYVDLPDQEVLRRDTVGVPSEAPVDLRVPGVPAEATAVAVRVSGTATTAGGSLGFLACDHAPASAASTLLPSTSFEKTIVWVPLVGATCFVASSVTGLVIEVAGYFAPGPGAAGAATVTGPPEWRFAPFHAPGLVPVDPTRLLDTRTAGVPLDPASPQELALTGVPAATRSVALNVTVTEPQGAGFVTVWPCAEPRPLASSVNFTAGQTVANAVMVSTGLDRRVCFASLVPTHLVVDLSGAFVLGAGAGYVPRAPTRLFDTRAAGDRPGPGGELAQALGDRVGADTVAVALNVTATEAAAPGYVTVYPCGTAPPLASNLNVVPGRTVPNLVTVRVPAGGRVCFTSNVAVHLIADLFGSYETSAVAGFVGITPERTFDTREGDGGPVPAGASLLLRPTVRVEAWVFNTTVTAPTMAGYVAGHDCSVVRPDTSNLNYVAGQTVANLVIVRPAPTLLLCFYAHGTTHLLADLAGWFTTAVRVAHFPAEGSDVR